MCSTDRVLVVVSALFIGFALPCGCSSRYYVISKTPISLNSRPAPDKARVYFLTPVESGMSEKVEVFILKEMKLIAHLRKGMVYDIDLPAGQHIFISVAAHADGIAANLAGGKVYYVRLFALSGRHSIWNAREVYMEPILPGTEQWKQRAEWLATLRHVELDTESAENWDADYAEDNAIRFNNFRIGVAKLKVMTPEAGE
jgi:hypothetical protein